MDQRISAFALLVLVAGCGHETAPARPEPLRIDLALQNAYSGLDLAGVGAGNQAWCMNGSALRCSYADTMLPDPVGAFLAYTDGQIRASLESYLNAHPALQRETQDWVILDMEYPIQPHDLGEAQYDARRSEIIEAFRRRILIAREVLPNAALSMYGVIVGNSRGLVTAGFLESMQGYEAMASGGVFDALDYVTPVLYQRFGPDDRYFETIDAYTEAVLTWSATLSTSDGRPVALAPLLGFRVSNGSSLDNGDPVEVATLELQLEIVRRHPEVARVGFWADADAQPDFDILSVLAQVLR